MALVASKHNARVKDCSRAAVGRQRRPARGQSACIAAAAAVALASWAGLAAADTADNVNNGSTDLSASGSYSAGAPTTTSDVTFTNAAYSPAAFAYNVNGGSLGIGALVDLDASNALTIQNNVAGSASSIQLNSTADSESPAAADLLYVASGANLTVGGGAGGTLGLVLNASGNFDVAGTATIAGPISGSFTKTGAGLLTLSGTNGYSGTINDSAGTLSLTGGLSNSSSSVLVGLGSGSATLDISSNVTAYNMSIGGPGSGAVYQTAGTVVLTDAAASTGGNAADQDFSLGAAGSGGTAGYGYYAASGGTLTANQLDVGARSGGAVGVMDVTGGAITSNGVINVGRGNSNVAGQGLLNVISGSVTYANNAGSTSVLGLGFGNGTSVVNVGGGTAVASLTDASNASNGVQLATQAATTGTTTSIVNLLAKGTLTTTQIFASNSSGDVSLVNFNGGTLKATGVNGGTAFLTGTNLTGVEVYGGGGTIDNSGTNITIGAPLAAPGGSGVSGVGVSGGVGYVGAPFVQFNNAGTGGTGASGYAVVSGGAVTNIVITNPGTGYTSAPTVTLLGGGATTAATVGTVTTAANVITGGVTFVGSGVTTLTGASTYGGATTVTAGTLALSGTGSINGSASILVNGAGAKFLQASSVAVAAPITVTSGTLDGTTTVGAVTLGSGATIADGNGSAGTLTASSVSFLGAGTANLFLSGTPTTVGLNVSGGLSTTSSPITLDVSATGGFVNGTTYDLIGYGSLSGAHDFVYGAGLTARQSAVIGVTSTTGPGYVTLVASGDSPKWTGLDNGNWQVGTTGSNHNWKLITAGTPTDYIEGDQVLFDDSATGSTSVNISAANVSPTSTTFNNSSKSYSLSGSYGIAGTGSLTKSGTGSLTINTSNSYSGGTTVNGGTLTAANASALGSSAGSLTVNGGTLDLDGNSPTVATLAGTGGTVLASTGSSVLTISGGTTATYAGTIGGSGGTVGVVLSGTGTTETLGGNNTLSGGVQVGSGSTLILSGSNALTPTQSTLFIHNGGTLQLQANAGNTSLVNTVETANVITGLANDGSDLGFQFSDSNGGSATLQLRGDQNVTFNDTAITNGVGNTTLNYDVNNLNNDGTKNVTLSVGAMPSYQTQINVSGNPTYTLNFGGITNANGAYTEFDVNSANLVIGPIGTGGSGYGLNLYANAGNITAAGEIDMTGPITVGAAAGYKVALNGPIPNGAYNTSVTFGGAGTLVINGTDTYAGGTTLTGGVLAGTGSVTSLVTLSGATITAGSGATKADSIGTLTTSGGQNWSSGSFVDKVASTTGGAGVGNDVLVMSSLTIPTPSSFGVSLLATNGSSPAFTASNAKLTASPVAGSYIVLATDSEGSGSPFNTPATVAALELNLTVSGVATKSAGDSIQLDGYFDGTNYDLIAEDVAAPEPTSLLLAGVVAGPLVLGRRRRRSARTGA